MGVYIGVANYTKKQYLNDQKMYTIMHKENLLARILFYKMYTDWSEDEVKIRDDAGAGRNLPWEDRDFRPHSEWEDVTLFSMKEMAIYFQGCPIEEELKKAIKEVEEVAYL